MKNNRRIRISEFFLVDRRICIPLFTPLLDYGRLRKLTDSRDIVKIKAIRPNDIRD